MSKFLLFEEARQYVRQLGLKKQSEWEDWCKNNRPPFIPRSPHQVYKSEWVSYMDWMGYKKMSYKRDKYSINEDFFEIWTHDMAYILGFWWADGCIYESLFSITQSNKDKYLLELIAKTMGFDGPIKETRSKYCHLNIYCRNLVESIKKIGGTERKSLTCEMPNVPEEFLPDFIRGLWDGDGNVSISRNSIESSLTSGSEKFSYGLLLKLKENINGFRGNVRSLKEKYYRVRVAKNSSILLREYMYNTPSNLFLIRKKNKFYDLGSIKVAKSGFMPYKEAEKFVHKLGIRSKTEWCLYWKENTRPVCLPSVPDRTYKDRGWKSWKVWLGYEKERVKGERL